MPPTSDKEPDLESEKKALKAYAKYSSIAFQLVAIIGFSTFVGYKLDAWMENEVHWVTALSGVLGVCLAIYQTIRQLK
ncbi:MAG: AtpZ/AtpI family protein [Sphingobacteriaceae bacterium]